MPRVYTRRTVIDRIFDKVEEVDGHWIWTGAVGSSGYGQINDGGHDSRAVSVHRTVWEHFRGPIPDGLELDHLETCLRLRCCNPDCLDPVTHAENMRRRTARVWRCRNGHDYTPENTRITAQGHRNCRQCGSDRERERRARLREKGLTSRGRSLDDTHCRRGLHVLTPENTWQRESGPTCKDCMSESAKARAARDGGAGHHTRLRRKLAESGSGSNPECTAS